jgi:MSHA biogenesis protein MshJ
MTQILEQWIKRLDALSERERVLIFLAGLAVVLAVAYAAGIEPALKQRHVLSARMQDQRAQMIAAEAQKQALAHTLAQDPDAPLREQIAGKQRVLAEIDSQLAGLQRTLIGPERMATVLEQLVGPERGVRLVSLRNLPASPLLDKEDAPTPAGRPADRPAGKAAAGADQAAAPHVFKHGVEVVVEGSYANLLAYVARLEGQPWQVYWGKTELSADYPKVVVALTLYTLSLDRAWLVV